MANRTVYIKDIDNFIEKIVTAGFTYRELARRANSNPTSISLLTKGERNPSPELAVNICKALNCNFDDIFFIKNVDNSKQNK
jgi:putative transcriptional regulator|nr:MAG TPA: helix-turn-helix domain protein [Caudoviricetes sp.]